MITRKNVCLIFFIGISTFLYSQKSGMYTDVRDGRKYKWVQIGEQVWMAENLAYLSKVYPENVGVNDDGNKNAYSYVYGYSGNSVKEAKNTTNFQKYGVLYNWNMAIKVCPSGWHLPSDDEFKKLERFVGLNTNELDMNGFRMSGDVGAKLRSKTDWISDSMATDLFGFNAIPGGFRHSGDLSKPNPQGGYSFIGKYGFLWTSTKVSNEYAYLRELKYYSPGIKRLVKVKNQGCSIRCIKD